MWEKIQIAMIFRKILIAKYFLQYFQYLLDMPFFNSILKNRYHIYIYTYIDPIYSILYQYISCPVMLPNVLMYIDLYFFQNITDYQTYFYSKAWNIYF